MHRSFNRIIDGDDELKSRQIAVGGDPYQSMYSQAFGPRQASQKSLTLERQMQRQVRTPQKSASV
jgi:hypothetical protein